MSPQGIDLPPDRLSHPIHGVNACVSDVNYESLWMLFLETFDDHIVSPVFGVSPLVLYRPLNKLWRCLTLSVETVISEDSLLALSIAVVALHLLIGIATMLMYILLVRTTIVYSFKQRVNSLHSPASHPPLLWWCPKVLWFAKHQNERSSRYNQVVRAYKYMMNKTFWRTSRSFWKCSSLSFASSNVCSILLRTDTIIHQRSSVGTRRGRGEGATHLEGSSGLRIRHTRTKLTTTATHSSNKITFESFIASSCCLVVVFLFFLSRAMPLSSTTQIIL